MPGLVTCDLHHVPNQPDREVGKLQIPRMEPRWREEMGGKGGGTNPEQLFAVGYAACIEGALMPPGATST